VFIEQSSLSQEAISQFEIHAASETPHILKELYRVAASIIVMRNYRHIPVLEISTIKTTNKQEFPQQ
tara:strand:- start:260 stop:460 length:201 start_codon:yes stop_codon:yes gene_type:complete